MIVGARVQAGRRICPVARAARLLGDTWTLLILRDLADGERRFSELEQSTGISPRVLSGRLKELERQSILTRQIFAAVPPRVEYRLTEKGEAALPLIDALRQYGDVWLPESDDEPCLEGPAIVVDV
ncbi:MAG TPA: helix-turn-helix domain-containing protein [Chloroflexota bacterium]|nr:helix-turn-helix domain-containing protein [Chloroflexota bacterium]